MHARKQIKSALLINISSLFQDFEKKNLERPSEMSENQAQNTVVAGMIGEQNT